MRLPKESAMIRPKYRFLYLSCTILLLLISGCNFPGAAPPTEPPTELPAPTATEILETPTPVVLDLCTLLTDEEAQQAMGAAVESSADMGVANCTYSTIGTDLPQSVSVSSAQGMEAKTLNLVGVQLILAFAPDQSALSALTELVDNAEDLSVWEIVQGTIAFQEDLGSQVSSVEELGSQALWLWNPAEYGTLMIVEGETYLSFNVFGFDAEEARRIAVELAPIAQARIPASFTVSTSGEFGGGFEFEWSSEDTEELQPTPAISGPPAVWLASQTDGTVTQIDPEDNQVLSVVLLEKGVSNVVAMHDTIYVTNHDLSSVYWIDPLSHSMIREVEIGAGTHLKIAVDAKYLYVAAPRSGRLQIRDRFSGDLMKEFSIANCWDAAISEYGLWVQTGPDMDTIVHIDPASLSEVQRVELEGGISKIKYFDGHYWLGVHGDAAKRVLKVDPQTYQVVAELTVETGETLYGMGVGEGAVWVAFYDGTILKIDPESGQEVSRAMIPIAPGGIAAGHGAVWVTHAGDHVVTRLDPETLQVIASIPVGQYPFGIAVSP
jgi:YVTN family beta-propeller protein